MIQIDPEIEISSVRVVYESELEKMQSDPHWVLIAIIQDDTNKFVWGRAHDHRDADNPVNKGNGIVEIQADLSETSTKLAKAEAEVTRLLLLVKKTGAEDTNQLIEENHSLRESVASLEGDNRYLNTANGNLMIAKDKLAKEESSWRNKVGEIEEKLKRASDKIENQRRDIFLGGECLRQIRHDFGEDEVQGSIDKILKFSSNVLFAEKRTVECPECDYEIECGNLTNVACSECGTNITVPGWQPFEDRPVISQAD